MRTIDKNYIMTVSKTSMHNEPSAPPEEEIQEYANHNKDLTPRLVVETSHYIDDTFHRQNDPCVTEVPITIPSPVYDYFDLGRKPIEITCPLCGYHGLTKTLHKFSKGTLLWTGIWWVTFWPFMLGAFCFDEVRIT